MRMPGRFLLLLYLLCCAVVSGQAQLTAKPKAKLDASAAIRAVLDAQVAAWNAGQLEEFMVGYWRASALTFVSGGRKLQGWDATLDRYRKTYQADGKEMGKLAFKDLDIELLGPTAAFVRGQFHLKMSDGQELGGRFTLIFRKFKNGWKIVHDHTSSNQ
jgi:ketosteroid isomerase-like protein